MIDSGGGIGASEFVFSATPNSTINSFLLATNVSGTTACVEGTTHATLRIKDGDCDNNDVEIELLGEIVVQSANDG
jgi:hypothetical protein